MGDKRWSVARGYVYWRKTNYAKDGVLNIAQLHELEVNRLPKSTLVNKKDLETFLNALAPPLPRVARFANGNPNNFKNISGSLSKSIKEVITWYADTEKTRTGEDIFLKWKTKRGIQHDNVHITGKDINQLIDQYEDALNLLGKILRKANKNAKDVSDLAQLKKRFQQNQKKLKTIKEKMIANRQDTIDLNSRSWMGPKKDANIIGENNQGITEVQTIISELEQIQQLFAFPTAYQFGLMHEDLVTNIDQTYKKCRNKGIKELAKVTKTQRVGNKAVSTDMAMLSMNLQKQGLGNTSFFDIDIIEDSIEKKTTTNTFKDPGSGAVLTTQSSAQTVDVIIDLEDSSFGVDQLRASIKAYDKLNSVSIVSGAPLTTILEISSNKNFLTHYLNIMSYPIYSGEIRSSAQITSDDDRIAKETQQELQPYLKRLMLMRALGGIRGGNRLESQMSNVFLIANKNSWKVYDTYELLRSSEALEALRGAGQGLSPVVMPFEPQQKGENLQTTVTRRISQLYARLHGIKLHLSLNMNKLNKFSS